MGAGFNQSEGRDLLKERESAGASNELSKQLIDDFLKIAEVRMQRYRTPLLECKYVENMECSKTTAAEGSKITLAYLRQAKLNKRELKALKKENTGYFDHQEFPLEEK